MKRNKKGISLVTLVITIIVMIILASIVIINLGQTNILKNARQATFKQNLENYMTELSMYVGEEKIKDSELDIKTINATSETIATFISSITEEDKEKFAVIGGNVVYKGNNLDEQIWCEELGIRSISGYDEINQVNTPKLAEGMIPVRYDDESSSWVKADVTNKNNDWYKYDDVQRKWANVVTVNATGTKTREYYLDAPIGTPINIYDITTMFVWIPRYAYSINEGYYKTPDTLTEEDEASNQRIDISFLVGTTNSSFNGTEYTTYDTDYIADGVFKGEATPKIVHPAFKFGDDILTGIWVAKFEAGGKSISEIRIGPVVNNWRNITIGEAQQISMLMKEDQNRSYGFDKETIDTHLIKNTEWGAVAYLSASPYGKVPMINANTGLITGYQGTSNQYNTTEGAKASTTHNVYGIYDMNGGAIEYVATFLDNGSSNIGTYGGSHFENNRLKKEYEKYWDKCKTSEEDNLNKIKVADLGDGITEVTREDLMKVTVNINGEEVNTSPWNEARLRIAKETYNFTSAIKGCALNELNSEVVYFGVRNTAGVGWNIWYITEQEKGGNDTSWNKDNFLFFATTFGSFGIRGGYFNHGSGAGIFSSGVNSGAAGQPYGFRPTCIVY